MFIPITGLPDSLAEYLSSYEDLLSKPQRYHFQIYVVGLVTCEGNRTVTNIKATVLPGEQKDDTSASRFVNQYKWSEDEVDQHRVALAREEIVTWLHNRENGRPGQDLALRTLGDVCRAVKRKIVHALVEWLYDLFQAEQNPQVACALLGVRGC